MTLGCALVLSAAQPVPETIYYNGRVITMSDRVPSAEAFAVTGNRFVAVGTNADVLRLAGPETTKTDLKGRTVVPGLIDAHTHPIDAAISELDGPLPAFPTIRDIQQYIRHRAPHVPLDRPILVPKIYASRLSERRYPTRQELDAAAPDRPALVDNGYSAVLNSVLLATLGITRDTPNPPNGKIGRDAAGEPTGLILGAPDLLAPARARGEVSEAERVAALNRMLKLYNRAGITSTIDRGQTAPGFRVYQRLRREGGLTVRMAITYRISGAGTPREIRQRIEAAPLTTGWGDEWLRVAAIKVVLDGGILTGTAFLREPYGRDTALYGYSDPNYRGELTMTREAIHEFVAAARDLGWQTTAHVTGGGSLDLLLDAYEAANRGGDGVVRARRFTATHANFPDRRAIARAAQLGVAFDVQPAWLHLDGALISRVLGPQRARDFLPLRSLVDAGVLVAGGSDHMVRSDPRKATNPYHPFFGMWMAISRRTADGTVLTPEERLTRQQALALWTRNAAALTFEEDRKGSIEPGKLADFAGISADYLTCPEDQIRDIDVVFTVVDGRIVVK
jgi:predicted amidohydrolase YtcJ